MFNFFIHDNESYQVNLVSHLVNLLTSFYPSLMKFLNLYLDNETEIRNNFF